MNKHFWFKSRFNWFDVATVIACQILGSYIGYWSVIIVLPAILYSAMQELKLKD